MTQNKTVTVHILDKEYCIACPEDERNNLESAARYLDGKMREIRHTGKVIGNDRVAVMAAINLTHELLQLRDEHNRLLAKPPIHQETKLPDGQQVITHSVQYDAENLHQQMQDALKA